MKEEEALDALEARVYFPSRRQRATRHARTAHARVKAMKPSTQDLELFDSFADELLVERNARPLLIVGASKIDHLLMEILRGFLLPKLSKGKEQDELLEGDSPLGTFSSRIKLCRRLGLIDETLYSSLERLRAIRNLSAHSVSFDYMGSPIRDRIADFRVHISKRRSFALTRTRYFGPETLNPIEDLQCMLLTVCVVLEALGRRVRRVSTNKRATQISAT